MPPARPSSATTIRRLAGARTVLVMSHRLRLASVADPVAVIDAGRVAESGRRPISPSATAPTGGCSTCGRPTPRPAVVTTFRRLFGLLAGHRRWIAVGALLGFLAIGSNVALMAMSAYLISKAAIVSNVAEIALAITAVRVLAIGRAAFRYLERYVTHARRSRSWPTCGSGSSPRSSRSRRRAWRPVGAATCSPGSSPTSRRSRTSTSGSSSRPSWPSS